MTFKTFVALWRLSLMTFVAYDVCRIKTFVGYDICRLMMYVVYDVCRLIVFVAYDVCRIMMFVAYEVWWHITFVVCRSAAGWCGHLLQYMHKYNAESPKQDSKRFNSQVRQNTLPIWVYNLHMVRYCSALNPDQVYFCRIRTLPPQYPNPHPTSNTHA